MKAPNGLSSTWLSINSPLVRCSFENPQARARILKVKFKNIQLFTDRNHRVVSMFEFCLAFTSNIILKIGLSSRKYIKRKILPTLFHILNVLFTLESVVNKTKSRPVDHIFKTFHEAYTIFSKLTTYRNPYWKCLVKYLANFVAYFFFWTTRCIGEMLVGFQGRWTSIYYFFDSQIFYEVLDIFPRLSYRLTFIMLNVGMVDNLELL